MMTMEERKLHELNRALNSTPPEITLPKEMTGKAVIAEMCKENGGTLGNAIDAYRRALALGGIKVGP